MKPCDERWSLDLTRDKTGSSVSSSLWRSLDITPRRGASGWDRHSVIKYVAMDQPIQRTFQPGGARFWHTCSVTAPCFVGSSPKPGSERYARHGRVRHAPLFGDCPRALPRPHTVHGNSALVLAKLRLAPHEHPACDG